MTPAAFEAREVDHSTKPTTKIQQDGFAARDWIGRGLRRPINATLWKPQQPHWFVPRAAIASDQHNNIGIRKRAIPEQRLPAR
jgi:hypothetical protein